MIARIMSWFTVDPEVSLLMVLTAVVLFGSALARKGLEGGGFWPWLRRLIEASVGAVLFLGLLWGFRNVLNNNINTFYSTHGSQSDLSRESAYTIWGRPHVQDELTVSHSIEVEVREEIPREDPSQPPLYRTTKQRQPVPQNSIRSFRGSAVMTLSDREKGYAYYSGFILQADYSYEILNDSGYRTDADFSFPLSPGQTIFQDFYVRIEGEDIEPDLRFEPDRVFWARSMSPHEQITVDISYTSRGMDFFYYHIPVQRDIRDFVFTLSVDRLPTSLLNYPDGVLTPTEIRPTPDGAGSILTWRLDKAITTAGMGVALLKPEQPGEKVLRMLVNSPYALTMLGAVLALTMMILGFPVNLLELALMAGAYSVEFLLMSGISDSFLGFWGSLAAGAGLTLFLTFLLFRNKPSRKLKILVFGLVAVFAVFYPLSGLIDNLLALNSFDHLIQAGVVVYLFLLSVSAAKREDRKPASA
jgi:hypothetical protein